MGAGDRLFQILPDTVEGQFQGWPPADQNIIMPGLKATAATQPYSFTQAPPDAIALDGVADFLRYGEADTDGALVLAFARLQNESRRRNLDAGRSGQKIRPLPQTLHRSRAGIRPAYQALRRLRPRERRAATTLRPPLVAMRARKP